MQNNPKEIHLTLENKLEVDPEKSLLPIILCGDRTIVEYIEPGKWLSEKAKLERPANAKEAFAKGRIVCIGDGSYGSPIPKSLKVNQFVNYWHQMAIDYEIKDDDKKYHLIRVTDIFAQL